MWWKTWKVVVNSIWLGTKKLKTKLRWIGDGAKAAWCQRQDLRRAAKRLVFSDSSSKSGFNLVPNRTELNPGFKCLSVFLKESFSWSLSLRRWHGASALLYVCYQYLWICWPANCLVGRIIDTIVYYNVHLNCQEAQLEGAVQATGSVHKVRVWLNSQRQKKKSSNQHKMVSNMTSSFNFFLVILGSKIKRIVLRHLACVLLPAVQLVSSEQYFGNLLICAAAALQCALPRSLYIICRGGKLTKTRAGWWPRACAIY